MYRSGVPLCRLRGVGATITSDEHAISPPSKPRRAAPSVSTSISTRACRRQRGDAATRLHSLLDEAAKGDGANRRDLTHDQRQGLKADFTRIQDYYEREFTREGARGLAIFTSGLDNVWRPLALTEPVRDDVRVGRALYLAPLVPLVGRGEGAVVVVVGRERGQFYLLRGGRLEALADHTEEQPGQHDQGGWSQSRFQRHIETLVHDHLKEVAEELDRVVRRLHGPQVVVISSEETRRLRRPPFQGRCSRHRGLDARRGARAGSRAPRVSDTGAGALACRAGAGGSRALARGSGPKRTSCGGLGADARGRLGRPHRPPPLPGRGRPLRRPVPALRTRRSRGREVPTRRNEHGALRRGLDLAVHQTLIHGGSVWAVQHRLDLEPVEGIGALLRY